MPSWNVWKPPAAAAISCRIWIALRRAASHVGKPYDFLFDFRTADRMVCTEVIYRGFHGIGPVHFHLEEVGGRLCLPAEEFVMQAMDCGFRIVACAGLRGDRLFTGMDAELAFHDSRQSWGGMIPAKEKARIFEEKVLRRFFALFIDPAPADSGFLPA